MDFKDKGKEPVQKNKGVIYAIIKKMQFILVNHPMAKHLNFWTKLKGMESNPAS